MSKSAHAQAPGAPSRRVIGPTSTQRVAPILLGLPLATPRQRLLAMIADLSLIAALVGGRVTLALLAAAGITYLMVASPVLADHRGTRPLDLGLRGLCVILVVVLLLAALSPLCERLASTKVSTEASTMVLPPTPGSVEQTLPRNALESLFACGDDDCRQAAAASLAQRLRQTGHSEATTLATIEALATKLAPEPMRHDRIVGAARAALATMRTQPPVSAEHATPAMSAVLLPAYGGLLSVVYFTVLPVLRSGLTPGKRLLGLRVLHLGGRPLGLWDALLRFGGYASGLTTGLLGFLQVYWQDNAQAVQDRLAHTAVIDEGLLDKQKADGREQTRPPAAA